MSLFRCARHLPVLLVLCGLAGGAEALVGEVIRVSDGDTVWVRPLYAKPVKVRLQGIDAPERCQDGGPQAQAALAAHVLHRQVDVDLRARDDYGRAVGTLKLGGEDIGAWMVVQGLAWSYRYRENLGPYAAEEAVARRLRRGVFARVSAQEPREFRKTHGACE